MVRKRVTNPIDRDENSETEYDIGEQYVRSLEDSRDPPLDSSIANIGDVWANLFGFDFAAESGQERGQSDYRF